MTSYYINSVIIGDILHYKLFILCVFYLAHFCADETRPEEQNKVDNSFELLRNNKFHVSGLLHPFFLYLDIYIKKYQLLSSGCLVKYIF